VGGVWELTAIDRVIIGAGGDYDLGDVGGEATHTLTVAELPHVTATPAINFVEHQNVNTTGALRFTHGGKSGQLGSSAVMDYGKLTLDFGNDKPHNNMMPYVAYYHWKRTA